MTKRYIVQVAAHNLGLLMRKLFGIGKPRTLQGGGGLFVWIAWGLYGALGARSDYQDGRGQLIRLSAIA